MCICIEEYMYFVGGDKQLWKSSSPLFVGAASPKDPLSQYLRSDHEPQLRDSQTSAT